MLESRDKLHFMKVAPEEWFQVKQQLEEGYNNG